MRQIKEFRDSSRNW